VDVTGKFQSVFIHLNQYRLVSPLKYLRQICGGLATCLGKLKHLGIDNAPKRSTLSYANEHQQWQLYQKMFFHLLEQCRSLAKLQKLKFRFKNKLFSLDATVIELCVTLFDWAKFR